MSAALDTARRWARTEQAAARIGKSPRTLERWRGERTGPPYFKFGKTCLYDVAELDCWIEAQRRLPPPATEGSQ